MILQAFCVTCFGPWIYIGYHQRCKVNEGHTTLDVSWSYFTDRTYNVSMWLTVIKIDHNGTIKYFWRFICHNKCFYKNIFVWYGEKGKIYLLWHGVIGKFSYCTIHIEVHCFVTGITNFNSVIRKLERLSFFKR